MSTRQIVFGLSVKLESRGMLRAGLFIFLLGAIIQPCVAGVTVSGHFDSSTIPDLFMGGTAFVKDAELTPDGEGYPFKGEGPQRALRFNPSSENRSSRLDLPIACFPFKAGSFTMWVKPRDITRSHKLLSFYGKKGRGYFLYYRKMRDGYWMFLNIYSRGKAKTYKVGNFKLKKNEWVYVGFTWDVEKKQIALYHNGQQLLLEDGVPLHHGISKEFFNIGYYDHKSQGPSVGAGCDFDELVIEDEVLSAEEIYWRFKMMEKGKAPEYKISERFLETQFNLAQEVLSEADGLLRASKQVGFKVTKLSDLYGKLKETVDILAAQGKFDNNGKLERDFFTAINNFKKHVLLARKELIDHIVAMPSVKMPLNKDWFSTMRVASSYPKTDKSPKGMAEGALKLFMEGVNTLNSLSFGAQFTWNAPDLPVKTQTLQPPNLEYGKLATEMCHKLGIRVIMHTTTGYVDGRIINVHPDWVAVDLRTKKPVVLPGKIWKHIVPLNYNHKGWRKHLFSKLREAIEFTGVDGIMPDEIHWSSLNADGSDLTRELFRKETGYDLPDPKDPLVWKNSNSPLWRAWTDARRRWIADFVGDLKKQVLDPLGKDFAYMTCVTGPTKPWRHETGVDNAEQARAGMNVTFLEAECGPTHVRKRYAYATFWPRYYREMKVVCGISELFDTVPLTLAYAETCEGPGNEEFFMWSLSKAMGHAYWVRFRSLPKGMFDWERKHEDVFENSPSYADVAIVYSPDTNFLYGNKEDKYNYHHEFSGWCETLAERQIPYVVILDDDLENIKTLSKYKTIILPNTAIMTNKGAKVLEGFVKKGGHLIATFQTSVYDEGGAIRKKPGLLAQLLQRSFEEPQLVHVQLDSAAELFGDKRFAGVEFNVPAVTGGTSLSDNSQLKVYSYGKGRAMYFPWQPGSRHRFPGGHRRSKVFNDNRNPIEGDLLAAAVRYMHPEKWLWQVENLPRNVFINGFKQGNRRIIHLVNAMGGKKKNGQEMTPNQRVSYPLISERNGGQDIVLKISEPIASAKVISPDFDQPVDLKVRQEDEMSVIIIPVSLVHRYSIIVANIN